MELYVHDFGVSAESRRHIVSFRVQLVRALNHGLDEPPVDCSKDELRLVDVGCAHTHDLLWHTSGVVNGGLLSSQYKGLQCFLLFNDEQQPLRVIEVEQGIPSPAVICS